jgi:ribonuclease Z
MLPYRLALALMLTPPLIGGLALTIPIGAQPPVSPPPPLRTEVITLGTGTPIPDPTRLGPATTIVVDSVAYLFDAGAGVVRSAAAAGQAGVAAFAGRLTSSQPAPRFAAIFLTHLHSDHTLGLADAIFTPWIQGGEQPVSVYGPPGTGTLVQSILDGNAEDIRIRVASPGGPSPTAWRAEAHDVEPGVIYRDERITVRAFRVPHEDFTAAYGYRIDTPDRSIVISGDTRESEAVAQACDGCDVLVHEVYSDAGFGTVPPVRQRYHASAHTSATGVGRVATLGRAKLVVLTHLLLFGASEEQLLREAQSTYAGRIVVARDGGRY